MTMLNPRYIFPDRRPSYILKCRLQWFFGELAAAIAMLAFLFGMPILAAFLCDILH